MLEIQRNGAGSQLFLTMFKGTGFVYHSLILDPQAPDLGYNIFLLFKSHSLWYFVMTTTANQYSAYLVSLTLSQFKILYAYNI